MKYDDIREGINLRLLLNRCFLEIGKDFRYSGWNILECSDINLLLDKEVTAFNFNSTGRSNPELVVLVSHLNGFLIISLVSESNRINDKRQVYGVTIIKEIGLEEEEAILQKKYADKNKTYFPITKFYREDKFRNILNRDKFINYQKLLLLKEL